MAREYRIKKTFTKNSPPPNFFSSRSVKHILSSNSGNLDYSVQQQNNYYQDECQSYSKGNSFCPEYAALLQNQYLPLFLEHFQRILPGLLVILHLNIVEMCHIIINGF